MSIYIGHWESLDAIRSLAGVEVQITLAHLRNGLLEVGVNDTDVHLLPAHVVGKEDGEGGLTHASLLIGKCDNVVHNYTDSLNSFISLLLRTFIICGILSPAFLRSSTISSRDNSSPGMNGMMPEKFRMTNAVGPQRYWIIE